MPLDAPFRLGPFIVDSHGRLEPGNPDVFPSFHLAWRGCPVHASLDASDLSMGTPASLTLSATLGRVPSTAGADPTHNRARRGLTFAALQRLEPNAAGAPQLRLLPDHRMTMQGTRPVVRPVSAGDLLTQITCFLLDLAPYLDLLAEADVPLESVGAAVSSSAGTAKTWPG